MDFSCFQLFIDTTLPKPKLPRNENRIEKFLLVRILLMLLFRLIVERLCIFRPHCNISANTKYYELKISIHINFGTLISNLKSYFQYAIVMTSL